ncbi:MAG: AMP-binding protein [Sphingobacteriales bacterium]|nr:AMP-binding protein [Sphingobacteriales bacterium]
MAEWLDDTPYINLKTSGSTGTPKTIRAKKNNMLQSANATALYFDFKRGQNALLCLPVDYIAGKMMIVRALYSKLNLICIEPSLSPLEDIPEDMVIDFAPMTPMQLHGVINTGSVRNILFGGGPVSAELENASQTLKTEIFHGFGMTETLTHIALRRVNGSNRSPVYHGLEGVRFTTDDLNCLIIQLPFLTVPIVTNDVVELINEQSFIWKGRADHVINSGGIKLFPEGIENKLGTTISNRFFMAGLPDKMLGEKLCLFIEGSGFDTEGISALGKQIDLFLEKYEKPKEIIFIDKFSITDSGKIQRAKTVKYFLEKIEIGAKNKN